MNKEQFASIHPSEFDRYTSYWEHTPHHSSDYTLTNQWFWREFYGLQWNFNGGLCWIRQTRQIDGSDYYMYWAPIGDWYAVDWYIIPEFDSGLVMSRVPEELCILLQDIFPDRIHIEETPGQWEYIYATEELSSLSGRRFDSKRNHLKKFFKLYGEDYRAIGDENIQALIELQIDWCKWRECDKSPSLKAEGNIICDVLMSWGMFPSLLGGTLYNNNELLAFSLGEVLDDQTIVVHFEKGRPGIRGVYQAINNCFVRYECKNYEFVNREQDLGEEGLRKAKQSYHPIKFLKKNRVTISPNHTS